MRNFLYRFRYWFYGFIGYYIFVLLVILKGMIRSSIVDPFDYFIILAYYGPLLELKKLQGYPPLGIRYHIKSYEGFLLVLLYGLIISTICHLILSYRDKRKSKMNSA